MTKKAKKILTNIVRVIDYPVFVLVLPLCFIGLLFATPWILKQRRIWQYSAKGSRNALIIYRFSVEKIKNRGYEDLLPFQNPSLKWIGLLDPANSLDTNIKVTNDFNLIAWQTPKIARLMEKIRFVATSIIFRELIIIFKITSYCNKEQIGVLRAYRHNYPALRAYLVSCFIKIPFIVDISGNYELIRRLTGKTFYFKKLNKVPIIKSFARIATNWLYGLPLRHAFRVLGRNKNNYEHAFALGAPVERLSLLKISNFNAAFNSYNPAQPPPNPVEYPYILFVGRLSLEKFPLDVLAAFELAAPHLPEYRLVMIGDGTIRDDIELEKERSEYRDRIVLLGACLNEIVLNWTAHAKVAICPYSGSTLVEAMLCGIPVIAYDVENHAEIVMDDYTGFLVPFRNIAALAEKMVCVVDNYEEANKVGKRGRDLARIVFDQEKICKKESMYYLQALTDS